MATKLEANTKHARNEPRQDVAARDSLYLRTLGPGWVEVEPGIFVQRVGEHVLPPHAE
jgi:hypothetical protein